MKIVDRAGNEITVGRNVAYNQSGDVVPGTVEQIIPKWRKCTWHPGRDWDGSFRVKSLLTGKISVVKRPTSMLVIDV